MSYQSFFNYITFQQQAKDKINQKKISMAAICIFIGAMESNISSSMASYSSLFLHSFHLHNLLPMILHKSGSQQYRVFMITGPRYENFIPFQVPVNSDNCSLQFRLKGTSTRKHNLNLKYIKVCSDFASKVTIGNTNYLQNVS